jgi:hypothetical protein
VYLIITVITGVLAWGAVEFTLRLRHLDSFSSTTESSPWETFKKLLQLTPVSIMTMLNLFVAGAKTEWSLVLLFVSLALMGFLLYWLVVRQSEIFARQRQLFLGKKLLAMKERQLVALQTKRRQLSQHIIRRYENLMRHARNLRLSYEALPPTERYLTLRVAHIVVLNQRIFGNPVFDMPNLSMANAKLNLDAEAFLNTWDEATAMQATFSHPPSVYSGIDEQNAGDNRVGEGEKTTEPTIEEKPEEFLA